MIDLLTKSVYNIIMAFSFLKDKLWLQRGVDMPNSNHKYRDIPACTKEIDPLTSPSVASHTERLDSCLLERICNVLEQSFFNGFRLDSIVELDRFRGFWQSTWGEVISLSDVELTLLVKKCGIHYDKKIYVVSQQVTTKVRNMAQEYFDTGAQIIFFDTFYEKNYEWLYTSKIVSEAMLTKLFQQQFPSLIFKSSYFGYASSTMTYVLTRELLRVWGEHSLTTYENLAQSLIYIPLERIKGILGQDGDFIWDSTETFVHISKLVITPEERESVRLFASQMCNSRGYLSTTELPLVSIAEENYELSITALQNAVYRICLVEDFDKKGKIITRKGDILDVVTILREHCLEIERCSLEDLLVFQQELTGVRTPRICMEVGSRSLVRIDEDSYVADRYIFFDTEGIDEVIDGIMDGDCLPLRAFVTFGSFPDCGQPWNLFLLESFCRRFSHRFRFDASAYNASNIGAVIRKECDMNYDTVISHAVVKANIRLEGDLIGRFLFNNGYIGRKTASKTKKLQKSVKIFYEWGDDGVLIHL